MLLERVRQLIFIFLSQLAIFLTSNIKNFKVCLFWAVKLYVMAVKNIILALNFIFCVNTVYFVKRYIQAMNLYICCLCSSFSSSYLW